LNDERNKTNIISIQCQNKGQPKQERKFARVNGFYPCDIGRFSNRVWFPKASHVDDKRIVVEIRS